MRIIRCGERSLRFIVWEGLVQSQAIVGDFSTFDWLRAYLGRRSPVTHACETELWRTVYRARYIFHWIVDSKVCPDVLL